MLLFIRFVLMTKKKKKNAAVVNIKGTNFNVKMF